VPDAPEQREADPRYRDGSYHAAVFIDDPFVERVLAAQRARKLARLIRPTDTVFEFGVGTALNLRDLDCARKVGHDPSPDAADRCEAFGIKFVHDPDALADRFDVVLCHHVLEHLPDPFAALDRFKSWLAPEGRLVLYAPYEHTRDYRTYRPDDPNMHLFSWNPLTLGNLVTAAGYTVNHVHVRGYGYEQRLAHLAKWGTPLYRAALWLARFIRPCDEIELVARPSAVK